MGRVERLLASARSAASRGRDCTPARGQALHSAMAPSSQHPSQGRAGRLTGHDGSKDLLLPDAHALCDTGDDGRRVEVALPRGRQAPADQHLASGRVGGVQSWRACS